MCNDRVTMPLVSTRFLLTTDGLVCAALVSVGRQNNFLFPFLFLSLFSTEVVGVTWQKDIVVKPIISDHCLQVARSIHPISNVLYINIYVFFFVYFDCLIYLFIYSF